MSADADVVVVGAGNAGFCAALSAAEHGARVLLLEKAPVEWLGGNSYFTAGAIRTAHGGLEDVADLVDEVEPGTRLDPYSEADFLADLARVTERRCDPELAEIVAGDSRDAVGWLTDHGVGMRLMYDRQAYDRVFWGGLAVGSTGGGEGLIEAERAAAERLGVEIACGCAVDELLLDRRDGVRGVRGPFGDVHAPTVVMAAGGFEADPRLRAAQLGPNWDVAKVRGTPFNTGEALAAMLTAGAQAYGHWSGCHSIAWDAAAPPTGDRELTNRLSRQSYPLGIVVNRDGRRFLDEGADFRNYTYARYGAEILRQPGAIAAQLFDAQTAPLLRAVEYEAPGVSRVRADTLGELADGLGFDRAGLERTVRAFNAACGDEAFDPSVKDGKAARGIDPPKSNWAVPLADAPYYGFKVTCGITFTFGGVRVDDAARVINRAGRAIRGLHAAGELVGGLFFHNYPGGSGLTAGAVLGRRAGAAAAALAAGRREEATTT